jgi:hypothetical protein
MTALLKLPLLLQKRNRASLNVMNKKIKAGLLIEWKKMTQQLCRDTVVGAHVLILGNGDKAADGFKGSRFKSHKTSSLAQKNHLTYRAFLLLPTSWKGRHYF